MINTIDDLKIEIYADGADETAITQLAANSWIKGFTTNPTLMRAAGVTDYETFAKRLLSLAPGRPISFEVFSDDLDEMRDQALKIATWGADVFVKIPITNTKGESARPLLQELSQSGVRVNVTAILTVGQVAIASAALAQCPAAIVSVFAGRVADTGRDPVPNMVSALEIIREHPNEKLLWASTRELYNVVQADAVGCHIVTVTPDVLKKLPQLGRDLNELSLATVKMFREDAVAAGYAL